VAVLPSVTPSVSKTVKGAAGVSDGHSKVDLGLRYNMFNTVQTFVMQLASLPYLPLVAMNI